MTTQNSGVPREWWIAEGSYQGDWYIDEPFYQTVLKKCPSDPNENIIHVIEKSAYDQAIARAEKATEDIEEYGYYQKIDQAIIANLEAEVKRLKHLLDRAHEQFMEMYEQAKQALEEAK